MKYFRSTRAPVISSHTHDPLQLTPILGPSAGEIELWVTFERSGALEYCVACSLPSIAAAPTLSVNKQTLPNSVRATVMGFRINMVDGALNDEMVAGSDDDIAQLHAADAFLYTFSQVCSEVLMPLRAL